MISKILKSILGSILLVQGCFIFFAFFIGGVVKKFFDWCDIQFIERGVYYSMDGTTKAIYVSLGIILIVIFGKKTRRKNICNRLSELYENISTLTLFILNIFFSIAIFLGNIFLKDFEKYNNNLKQIYGKQVVQK